MVTYPLMQLYGPLPQKIREDPIEPRCFWSEGGLVGSLGAQRPNFGFQCKLGATIWACGDVSMLFSPHHGEPGQARLMSDLRSMINAEGQSSILSKCCITSKYDNRR